VLILPVPENGPESLVCSFFVQFGNDGGLSTGTIKKQGRPLAGAALPEHH